MKYLPTTLRLDSNNVSAEVEFNDDNKDIGIIEVLGGTVRMPIATMEELRDLLNDLFKQYYGYTMASDSPAQKDGDGI